MFTRIAQRKRPRRATVLAIGGVAAVALALAAAIALATPISDGGTYDLRVPDNTVSSPATTTTGGAIIQYIGSSAPDQALGSSGTGVFSPFYRLQASPSEEGFNTGAKHPSLDTSGGTWTHAILVSQIPVIQVGGHDYWEVWSDINESNSTPLISLNKYEVYFTDNANLNSYPFSSSDATLEYAFDGSIEINDVNQGSGRADLRYLIPVNDVPADCDYSNPACTTYFVLYSQWGSPSAATEYSSDGGFEEMDVKQYPTLQIVKNAIGGDAMFDYTVSGPTPLTPSIQTSSGTGSTPIFAVLPGTYQIAEDTPLPLGWTFTSATCSLNGGTPTTYTPGDDLVLGTTDHLVCTFTNTAQGYLKVVKNTSGGDGTFYFTNTGVTGLATSLSTSGGTADSTSDALLPGSGYAVAETTPTGGWDFTSASCKLENNDSTGSVSGSSITAIEVQAGKTTTCTFNNTAYGYLKLVKTAIGGNDTFYFTNTGVTGLATSLATSGGTADSTSSKLLPGSGYAVAETGPPAGWDFTSASCKLENNDSTGSVSGQSITGITVEIGKTTTCTFTNTKRFGAIKISKTDSKSGNPLALAEFDISTDEADTVANRVATVTTNATGTACYDGLPWSGSGTDYYVTEKHAPDGYAIDDTSAHVVTVDQNGTCGSGNEATYSASDTPLYNIQVNFADGGSGTTSAGIVCSNAGGDLTPSATIPPTGWDTTGTYNGLQAPDVITCVITVDP